MDVTISDRGDDSIIHSIGRAQSEFTTGVVEHIDCAGLSVGELGSLSDDCGQDGLRSSVEFTAWLTSPSARSSPID